MAYKRRGMSLFCIAPIRENVGMHICSLDDVALLHRSTLAFIIGRGICYVIFIFLPLGSLPACCSFICPLVQHA